MKTKFFCNAFFLLCISFQDWIESDLLWIGLYLLMEFFSVPGFLKVAELTF